MKTLGDRIGYIMEEKGLNYSSLARALSSGDIKFEHSNIRKYIKNTVKPSTDFYAAMVSVFDVNINWLLTGKGKEFMGDYVIKESVILATKKTPKSKKQK